MSIRTTILAVCIWLLSLHTSYAAPIIAEEPQLRAAVIHGIIRFTTWPDSTEKTSLSLCTIGKPISESSLKNISQIAALDVTIKSINNNDVGLDGCDVVVFGSRIKKAKYTSYIEQAKKLPILTICDECRVHKRGVIISLKYNQGRIGFTVNIAAAKAHDINFSSSLLELAMEVQQ